MGVPPLGLSVSTARLDDLPAFCQVVSEMRQTGPSGDLLIRTLAIQYASGTVLEPHTHDWAQLVYASEGVMSVHTGDGTWVVPPHRGVWIPAGVEHSVAMAGEVAMRTLYIPPT